MKNRNLLYNIILCFFLTFFIRCSKKENFEQEQNLYIIENDDGNDFFNDSTVITNPNIKKCNNILSYNFFVNYNFDLLFEEIKKQNILSSRDILYLENQEERNFLKNEKFLSKNIVKLPKQVNINHINELISKYTCIIDIGYPIFNEEKNIAILQVVYYCGYLCGEESFYIYKKR